MSTRKIRLGVVGLGRAFTLMLPTFLNDPRIELVAACDPREAARAQFAQDFSPQVFTQVADLARCEAVEVVYLASPHQFHAEHVEQVAVQGKHILLEKPMAISLQECDAIIAAGQRHGVKIIIGHCHSFDQPYLDAQKIIASGELGAVKILTALNFTDFLYRPRRPEELDTRQGGGVVFSQGAHQLDILRLLAGGDITRVRAVTGKWDAQRNTEGFYSAMLWFDNGAFASATYSGYGHFDSDIWMEGIGEMGQPKDFTGHGKARRRLEAMSPDDESALKAQATYGGPGFTLGNAASAPHHQHFGPVLISCAQGDIRVLPDRLEIYADFEKRTVPVAAPQFPRKEVIDELAQAVFSPQETLHNPQWARKTLQACLAMLESAETGTDITLI